MNFGSNRAQQMFYKKLYFLFNSRKKKTVNPNMDCGSKTSFIFTGSLESPLAASPSQAYHPSSTYFHQECQWFFDTPPARQLILKISTAQKMSK